MSANEQLPDSDYALQISAGVQVSGKNPILSKSVAESAGYAVAGPSPPPFPSLSTPCVGQPEVLRGTVLETDSAVNPGRGLVSTSGEEPDSPLDHGLGGGDLEAQNAKS